MGTNAGSPAAPDDRSAEATPAVRASDAERHATVERLGDHAASGRISLGELEERVGRAYAAATRRELDVLTTDLPALHDQADSTSEGLASPEDTGKRAPARRRRWFLAIMGGSTWRGRRRLTGTATMVSIMGGDDVDLREAEFDGSELVINAISLMGGPTIYLPDTVEVEFSGPAIMGGNDEHGSTRAARPGAPLVRIRSFALMGGVDVWRLPAEASGMRLKEARRLTKKMERGGR